MVLKLEPCTDDDMDRTFAIVSSAFGHEHTYFDAVYPAHDTPSGRKNGGDRLLAIKHSDPLTTFLKVTDTDTGEMIAAAKWNIYDGVVPEEAELDGDYWEGEEEKEYAMYMFREYLGPRRAAIKASAGKLVSLDLLAVDPKHQKRGAGRILVKWGTAVADEKGVKAVVEASNYGIRVYESEGFEIEHHHVIELPAKWAGRDKQRFAWMIRPQKHIGDVGRNAGS
ncbi:MAG: hypothetical protein Q9223_000357 [Gallowayella weberi]